MSFIQRFTTHTHTHAAGEQESTSIHYDDDAIAALLDRSLDMGDGESEVGQQNILANDYLSSFKVSH